MVYFRGMEVWPTQQRQAPQNGSSPKKTSRSNEVSPEIPSRLAMLAKEIWQLVFGGEGVPVWGTKFTEIKPRS